MNTHLLLLESLVQLSTVVKIIHSSFSTHRIYLIRNMITGQQYIGHTTASLQSRAANHQYHARLGDQRELYQAIRQFGEDAFSIQQIDEAITSKEADEKETQLIAQYNTLVPFGYNLSSGGSRYKHHDLSKIRNRVAHKGRNHSQSTRLKMSASQSLIQKKGATNSRAKTYVAVSPDGKIHHIEGLRQFARDHGIAPVSLRNTLKAGRPIQQGRNKGWQLITV